MEATQIYAISWACILVTCCLLRWPKRLVKHLFGPLIARLPDLVLQGLHKSLKLPQRTLYFWRYERITISHYAYLLAYIFGNGLLFVKPELNNGFRIINSDETQNRAAVAAMVNLVPVILGGRSCVIADAFDIPLHWYYFAHHWLARLAVVEIMMHVGIHAKRGIAWTAHAVFGLIALILLLLIVLSSVAYIRSSYKSLFLWSHLGLGISTTVALLLHIWLLLPHNASLDAKIPFSLAALAWLAASLYRWLRSQRLKAEVKQIYDHVQSTGHRSGVAYTGAALVKVKLRKSILIHSGSYFYVYFHKLPLRDRFQGCPMMVYSWSPLIDFNPWNSDCRRMVELTFLIEDRPHLSRLLTDNSTPITIEGPYGRDLRLHRFDTVCLVANGIGIAGILPIALSLADRSHYDQELKRQLAKDFKESSSSAEGKRDLPPDLHQDRTRRLNLFWVPDNNLQTNWIIDGLTELSKLDSRHTLVHVNIYEPESRDDGGESACELIPESFQRHCRILHAAQNNWAVYIKQQINWCLDTSPGDFAAAVCGTVDIRQIVNDVLSHHPRRSSFFDLEHQPRDGGKDDVDGGVDGATSDCQASDIRSERPGIELTALQPAQIRHRAHRVCVVQNQKREVSVQGYVDMV